MNGVKEAITALQQLAKDKFWGSVQLDFRDGAVTLIRKTETIKIEGREKNRQDDARAW